MAAPAEAVCSFPLPFSPVFRAYLSMYIVCCGCTLQMFMTLYGTQRTRGAARAGGGETEPQRGYGRGLQDTARGGAHYRILAGSGVSRRCGGARDVGQQVVFSRNSHPWGFSAAGCQFSAAGRDRDVCPILRNSNLRNELQYPDPCDWVCSTQRQRGTRFGREVSMQVSK